MKKKKTVKAWAIIEKDDGFLPDLDMAHLKGILHIHSRKADALRTIKGINHPNWVAVPCTITY